MRTENWCGCNIRFIEINGEWYAILKDICDALRLRTAAIAQRLDPSMLERVKVETSNVISNDLKYEHQPIKAVSSQIIGKDIGRKPGERKAIWMLAVNESGIYVALFASRRLEARKFRRWAGTVMLILRNSVGLEGYEAMQKLRKSVGLEDYEVMRMTEPEIQDQIADAPCYDLRRRWR